MKCIKRATGRLAGGEGGFGGTRCNYLVNPVITKLGMVLIAYTTSSRERGRCVSLGNHEHWKEESARLGGGRGVREEGGGFGDESRCQRRTTHQNFIIPNCASSLSIQYIYLSGNVMYTPYMQYRRELCGVSVAVGKGGGGGLEERERERKEDIHTANGEKSCRPITEELPQL